MKQSDIDRILGALARDAFYDGCETGNEPYADDGWMPTTTEAKQELYKLMEEVIGPDKEGITNIMIAMEHQDQRIRLDKLFGK